MELKECQSNQTGNMEIRHSHLCCVSVLEKVRRPIMQRRFDVYNWHPPFFNLISGSEVSVGADVTDLMCFLVILAKSACYTLPGVKYLHVQHTFSTFPLMYIWNHRVPTPAKTLTSETIFYY